MRTGSWSQAFFLQKQGEGKEPEGQPTANTPESEDWSRSQLGMVACVYLFMSSVYILLGVWD